MPHFAGQPRRRRGLIRLFAGYPKIGLAFPENLELQAHVCSETEKREVRKTGDLCDGRPATRQVVERGHVSGRGAARRRNAKRTTQKRNSAHAVHRRQKMRGHLDDAGGLPCFIWQSTHHRLADVDDAGT